MLLLKLLVLLAKPLVSYFNRIAAMYRGVRDQLESMEKSMPTRITSHS